MSVSVNIFSLRMFIDESISNMYLKDDDWSFIEFDLISTEEPI